MRKEIVINAGPKEARIALLENGELVELYIENPNNTRTLGDIHLGRVRNIMPSIQAAFVDIGQKQDAFLHFSDIDDNLPYLLDMIDERVQISRFETPPRRKRRLRVDTNATVEVSTDKDALPTLKDLGIEGEGEGADEPNKDKPNAKQNGKPGGKRNDRNGNRNRNRDNSGNNDGNGEDDNAVEMEEGDSDLLSKLGAKFPKAEHPAHFLKNSQKALVQIIKEPMASKGSRITTNVTLAGRFLVLVPYANYVAVSKRIWSYRERKRLRMLGRGIVPEGFGLIIRTVAQGKDTRTLDTDLKLLRQKWDAIKKKLDGEVKPPTVLHRDVSMVSSVIRDLFTDDYDRILVDDPKLFKSIKNYVRAVAPSMDSAIKEHRGKKAIFDAVGVNKAISDAFATRVNLPSGGYVIIEHTEAMHVIDVNSGRAGKGQGKSQEVNSLKVNLEASKVIAKQLRLRDLGGIIAIDFIDLREDKNRRKVCDELRRDLRKSRAVSKVLPMSDFGIVQVTRQRLRPSITTDENTSADGESKKQDNRQKGKGRHQEQGKQKIAAASNPVPKPAQELSEVLAFMENRISQLRDKKVDTSFQLTMHTLLHSHLTNGMFWNTPLKKMKKRLRVGIEIKTDDKLHPLGYKLTDSKGNMV